MSQTGGGPHVKVIVNDLESKILNIIGEAAVYGLRSTQDAPLDSEDVNQPDQPALNGAKKRQQSAVSAWVFIIRHNVAN